MSERDELALTIDHVTLSVQDIDIACEFYTRLLATVGLQLVADLPAEVAGVPFVGFGIGRKGTFWLAQRGTQTPAFHACFRVSTRAAVRAFHEAGLAAGGEDHGAPGVREIYHPAYYAAFILDPEGHNVEAVCFEPEA